MRLSALVAEGEMTRAGPARLGESIEYSISEISKTMLYGGSNKLHMYGLRLGCNSSSSGYETSFVNSNQLGSSETGVRVL